MEPVKLSEKARMLRNDYQRKWYAKHPGIHVIYNNRYWLKKAAKEAMNEKK